jgi:hypothetical protein
MLFEVRSFNDYVRLMSSPGKTNKLVLELMLQTPLPQSHGFQDSGSHIIVGRWKSLGPWYLRCIGPSLDVMDEHT